MSTLLANNIKSYTGDTVTISGSNINVQGNTILGDGVGVDTVTIDGHLTSSGNISASGDLYIASISSSGEISASGNLGTLGSLYAQNGDLKVGGISYLPQIGTSAWNFKTLIYSSTASIDRVSSSLIPMSSYTYNLGSTSRYWMYGYLSSLSVGNITASGNISSSTVATNDISFVGSTSEAAASSGELYTLSGSQIFSSSAWPGGSNAVFSSGGFSSSLFVFKKA